MTLHRSLHAWANPALRFLLVSLSFCGCGGKSSGSPDALAAAVDAALASTPEVATLPVPDADTATAIDAPRCPASCDDSNPCTVDTCDPVTHQCVSAPVADGTACEDGSSCTIKDLCKGGLCYSGPFKTCTAIDQCHVAGVCSPKTGECTTPNADNRTPCNDGLRCTTGDQCTNGVCVGTALPCSDGFVCDEAVGACVNQSSDGGVADGGLSYAFPTATAGLVYEGLQWASSGSTVVRNHEGRVFVGGHFAGTASLGAGTMDSGDLADVDLFLAELDVSTGKTVWSQAFGGPQNQTAIAVAVDGSGHLGLVGSLAGSLTVGKDTIIATTTADFFTLGASATDGTGLWAQRYTLRSNAAHGRGSFSSIAGDPNAAAFVICGSADQAATDVSASLTNQGGMDAVLARLDGTTGSTLWAQQIGGVNDETCSFVAVDAESNIYVVGTYLYGSSVSIGGLPPLPVVDQVGATWLFVAKLGPDGRGLWAQSIGNVGQASVFTATAVWPTSTGLILAGRVPTAATVGTASLSQSSPLFLAKLAAQDGTLAWAVAPATTQGGASDAITLLSSNSRGDLLMAGRYANTLSLGPFALPMTSRSGVFLAKLDGASGSLRAARGYGGATEVDQPFGMVADLTGSGSEKDSTLLVATFSHQIDLGIPAGALSGDPKASIPSTVVAKLAP